MFPEAKESLYKSGTVSERKFFLNLQDPVPLMLLICS